MFDKSFIGMIASATGKVDTKSNPDETTKDGYVRIKLESANIDYDSIAEFDPVISATLLNIQPIPFKSVNFGDQSRFGMGFKFKMHLENELPSMPTIEEYDFSNVLISGFEIKISDNVPVYNFTIDIPYDNGSYGQLFKYMKAHIDFEFFKTDAYEANTEPEDKAQTKIED